MILRTSLFVSAVAITMASTPALAGEIFERLNTPPRFVLKSTKTPEQLELCAADSISEFGTQAAFRDGPNRTVVTSGKLGKVFAALALNRTPEGTTISGHVHPAVDDKVRVALGACL